MELLNVAVLDVAAAKHPHTRSWLQAWRVVVQASAWHHLEDVREVYPTADGVRIGKGADRIVVTVFNVGGNDFRLLTLINYAKGIVQVERVLTHAEYSKNMWKNRYA